MIAHLLAFKTEAGARKALAAYTVKTEEGATVWSGRVFPCRAYIPGIFEMDGMNTKVIKPDDVLPGFRLWLALDAYDDTLAGLEMAVSETDGVVFNTLAPDVKVSPVLFGFG
jgi:hypothetical protein